LDRVRQVGYAAVGENFPQPLPFVGEDDHAGAETDRFADVPSPDFSVPLVQRVETAMRVQEDPASRPLCQRDAQAVFDEGQPEGGSNVADLRTMRRGRFREPEAICQGGK